MNVFILVNLLIAIGICLLAFFKLDWRCHLLALISVFQVAIVFEYGSVRVWAYHALAILIMFFVWINFFTQFDTRNKLVFYEMKFVWPIAILIISGSAFLPLVFEGISVYEPSQGMGFDLYPLQWTRSHIAQSGYLIINLSIMFYLACLPNDADFERTICSAFMWMFILAIFFFLWQTVSVLTGFYFPEAFFGGSRGRDYQVYWLEIGRRMNGTFAEPADLGLFSSACLGFGLGLFFYMHKYWIGAFFAVSGCLMAVASGSTTAYLAICAPLCILSFTSLMGRISPMLLIVFVVIGCLALSGLLATDWFWTKWDDVVTNKTETTSYEIRWETVKNSVSLFWSTGGIGVGLGSNRPTSMIVLLFSCLGILSLPVSWFLFISTSELLRSRNPFYLTLYLTYSGVAVAIILAIPDLSQVNFSFFTACVLATLIRLRVAKKLKQQNHLATKMRVQQRTGPFRIIPQRNV